MPQRRMNRGRHLPRGALALRNVGPMAHDPDCTSRKYSCIDGYWPCPHERVQAESECTLTIRIEVQKTIPFDTLNCLLGMAMPRSSSTTLGECPDRPSVVKASSVLTSDGQIVARGSSDDDRLGAWMNDSISRQLGSFQSQRGRRYVLDVNVLADGSSLDLGKPRLTVEVVSDVYEAYSIWGGIMFLADGSLGFVGITLMIVSWRRNR